MNLLVWSGNTGRKTELIPTESCMATPRKLSKIKYYSYILTVIAVLGCGSAIALRDLVIAVLTDTITFYSEYLLT
ncbi:MAG: hypothetical protein RLZZ184_3475 [Cyanobacteriota bacterium]